MSTDLVTFSDEQIKLLKRTICKPKDREATNDELSLFVGQCKRTGLDPFSKQIYAIFRKSQGKEVMTIQTAIDGFRLIAERTGSYMGKVATYWCGDDAVWHEVWVSDANPVAAKVIVRKVVGAHIAEIPAVAHWAEYVDKNSPMWKPRSQGGMPANQLAKCAEALSLRQAFPNDLSGMYTTDEMAQADAQPLAVAEPVAAPVLSAGSSVEGVALLSDEDRAELVAAVEAAGGNMDMLLVAVGADSTDDLTEAQGFELRQKLAEQLAEPVLAGEQS